MNRSFPEEDKHRSFENSVRFSGNKPNDAIEQKVGDYIRETFKGRRSYLPQFTLNNASMMTLAKHLLFHRTGSNNTLYHYAETVYHFCKFLNETPDNIVKQCLADDGTPNPKAILELTHDLVDFMDFLRCRNIAPITVESDVKGIKSFFSLNGVKIVFPFKMCARPLYDRRAISPEGLQKLLLAADLREKVIISILATSGLREGTLLKLRYQNVKSDLERNVIPALVTVEAEITKGKYHSYYTFLNEEAVEYLKAYFKAREIGTQRIPPEHICDESPVIRAQTVDVCPTNSRNIQRVKHNLFRRAGLISSKSKGRQNGLSGYSLRRYFKTQLTSAGVQSDYTEFMMGHGISRYHDVKMKGIDFMRGVYLSAGLRMQPRIRLNKIDALKEIMVSWGIDPEKFLTREALAQFDDLSAEEKINSLKSSNEVEN